VRTIPPVLLCSDNCFLAHKAKNDQIPHSILPLAALGQDPDEYKRKFNHLKQGTAELQRNIKVLVQLEELTASVDNAVDTLRQYKELWLQWLQTEKAQLAASIDQAIQEAVSKHSPD